VSGSVVPALKVFGLLFGVAAVLVLMDPGILASLDPRWHPKQPHGMQDSQLVGVWIAGREQSRPILILREDGTYSRGSRWPGYWHTDLNELNLDTMSWCGAANEGSPGSRASTYQLKWISQDSMEISNEGENSQTTVWHRVDPNSRAFKASIVEAMESSDEAESDEAMMWAYQIEDALCSAGFWKRENTTTAEDQSER
jgi:hypothetical protein